MKISSQSIFEMCQCVGKWDMLIDMKGSYYCIDAFKIA